MVFGMAEHDGVPSALVGLSGIDLDQEILRLEEMIRDGVRPHLPGLELTPVRLSGGDAAIVIRIPKSWNPPHQVIFQKAFRFYGRGSNGKYLLDVDELRSIFSLSEAVSEKIRQFRVHRVTQVIANDTPVSLVFDARRILHLVPLSAFTPGVSVDFSTLLHDGLFVSLMHRGGSMRHNIDGLLAYSPSGQGMADAYAQLYRNGIIEIVHALANSAWHDVLPASFELEVVGGVARSWAIFKLVGVSPPVVVMLSFVGVSFSVDQRRGAAFDRDPLLVPPEAVIQSFEQDVPSSLRPLLDATWNAADWPGSPNFDSSGNWNVRWR